jgi:hypothetical protein
MNWWKYDSSFAVKWREPQRFKWLLKKTEINEPGTVSFVIKMTAIFFGVLTSLLFIAWLCGKADPANEPPRLALLPLYSAGLSVLLTALGFVAAIVDGWFIPRTLVLARNWMGVIWEAQPRWLYEQIANVRFETLPIRGEEFRVMIVTPRKGRESTLALSAKMDPEQIGTLLRSKGVEVVEKI